MRQETFNIKKIIIFFLFALCFMFNVSWVSAQQVSLAISPPLVEVFIKPGKSIMIAYQLENLADPTILKTKVLPFVPYDDLGNIKIKEEFEGPIRFSLDNSDISLGQPFFLKTKDSQQLLLRIRVPEGAPEGDYYYTLLAETLPPAAVEGVSSSQAKATIGSNILITVNSSGKVDIKAKIALFDVLSRYKLNFLGRVLKVFDSNDKIPVVLIIQNKGKSLIKPQGEITLQGNFREKAQFEILPQNILAQSQRMVLATPSAEIETKLPSSLVLTGFFIGSYRLSTTVNFGDGSPSLFVSTSFIALPFRFIAAGILGFLIILLIIKKIKIE